MVQPVIGEQTLGEEPGVAVDNMSTKEPSVTKFVVSFKQFNTIAFE